MIYTFFFIKLFNFFNFLYLISFIGLFFLSVIISSLIVIAKNPMHAVFSLIISFSLIIIIMLVFLQCDFLAIIFLIIYVGAVSILFLFIVMLLNIRLIDLTDQFFNYFPAGMIIGFIFLFEFNLYLYFDLYYTFTNLDIYYIYIDFINNIDAVSDIILIAYILYEEYFLLFIFAAILLLVAMVGVILLTLRNVIEVKTQLIYSQVYRLLLLKNSTI